MSESITRSRGSRLRRAAVGVAAATALTAAFMGVGSPGSAQATSPFLLSDHGNSVIDSEGSYCWRGVGFSPNADTTVTALIGGGINGAQPGDEFGGALYAVTYDDSTGDITLDTLLADVTFPEGEEVSVDLATPVNLTAGQFYVLAMGGLIEAEESEASMYQVDGFDSGGIAGPSNLMGTFLPSSPEDALGLPDDLVTGFCSGEPEGMVGATFSDEDTTGTVPAIGFAFTQAPPTPPAPEPVEPTFTG